MVADAKRAITTLIGDNEASYLKLDELDKFRFVEAVRTMIREVLGETERRISTFHWGG